jgi:TusA-related sulfurtransferase
MAPGEILLVTLKGEEPLRNVPRSATEQGHEVLSVETDSSGISRLLIRRGNS